MEDSNQGVAYPSWIVDLQKEEEERKKNKKNMKVTKPWSLLGGYQHNTVQKTEAEYSSETRRNYPPGYMVSKPKRPLLTDVNRYVVIQRKDTAHWLQLTLLTQFHFLSGPAALELACFRDCTEEGFLVLSVDKLCKRLQCTRCNCSSYYYSLKFEVYVTTLPAVQIMQRQIAILSVNDELENVEGRCRVQFGPLQN